MGKRSRRGNAHSGTEFGPRLEKEQNESSRTEHARAPAGGAAVGELDRAATQRPTRLLPSLFLLLPALAIASLCQV